MAAWLHCFVNDSFVVFVGRLTIVHMKEGSLWIKVFEELSAETLIQKQVLIILKSSDKIS
jgi:hypothetical protein